MGAFFIYFRGLCLQRYIWSECGCLDASGHIPFYREDLFCGSTEYADVIAFPEKYNKSHCFASENMTSLSECEEIFEKLFHDLLCVKRVKESFLTFKHNSSKIKCNCPESCDSFEFDTFYSLAAWPSDGPQLDEAYKRIVLEKFIPHYKSKTGGYKKSDQYLVALNNVINYLSDSTKKKEIMSNFVRLTVYIKDSAVETIEDIAAYSKVDLLSDFGQYILSQYFEDLRLLPLIFACFRISVNNQIFHYFIQYIKFPV